MTTVLYVLKYDKKEIIQWPQYVMCPRVVVYAVDHIVAPSLSNNTRKIRILISAWNKYVSYTLVCVHVRLLLFYSVIFQSCKFHPCDFVRHFPVLQILVLQIQLSLNTL